MHLFHNLQYPIQNRNVHISVLNGALWDMEQVHYGMCELGQLAYQFDPRTENDIIIWFSYMFFHRFVEKIRWQTLICQN